MVKSQQPERVFIVTNIISPNGTKKSLPEVCSEGPPKIPPRMKKKGPALPDKPPHMRATPSQPPKEPLRPRSVPFNSDNRQTTERDPLRPRFVPFNSDNRQTTEREILVAASRGVVREKPVEKRQREPAKLLMPTSGGGGQQRKDNMITLEERLSYPTKKLPQEILRKPRPPQQPILLIPRGMVPPWGSSPVSYALWMQREAASAPAAMRGTLVRREPAREISSSKNGSSGTQRSGSVTRSGSLTSQGSSSSDSGNETFPKSVLKKQKRHTPPNSNAKGNGIANNSSSSKKLEHKKNVTFNAFATVQLMEE